MSESEMNTSAVDGANLSVDACISANKEDAVDELATALSGTELVNDDVTTVSFAGRQLKLDNEKDAMEVTEAIKKCVDLKTIRLEGNTIGIDAAKAIGKAFETKKSLEYALLKDMFTSRLKSEVPEAVRFMTAGIALSGASLYELDLSDNAFGPIGMKALAPFLEGDSCKNLIVLRLNNTGLGVYGGQSLAKCLPSLKALKIFICGRNRLCSSSESDSDDASPLIGEALAQLRNLEHIEIPQNGIRVAGIKALASAIKVNTNLRILNLNDNIITARGGSVLATAMRSVKTIESINFGDCLLKTEGTLHVVNALCEAKDISNLREIILSGNEIGGDEVIKSILKLCRRSDKNSTLHLDLGCNNFGDEGVETIKEELKNEQISLSLSDDEGTASEDDEEEDGYEEDDEGEESTQSEGNGNALDENPDITESEMSKTSDVDQLADVLSSAETSVDQLCELFVNVSMENFDHKNGTLAESAQKQAELILESAKKRSSSPYETANCLLGHMGLLKMEDTPKKGAKDKDLSGPFLALSHSAKKLDKEEKEVFQLFIGNKPTKATEQAGKFKSKLMQSLYS
ncbi:Ran GTPase-activating protein 1 [Halotydeus destructor]|nr:Ran GTPase-activating protein 1 [Halotydeus destructor]